MVLLALLACSTSYVLNHAPAVGHTIGRPAAMSSVRMQEEPEKLNVAETASAAIDSILQMLGDETPPPKTMINVKTAVQEGDAMEIGNQLYLLLIEQTLDYDIEDSQMVPTKVDYGNTDDPKVMEKMSYIYGYGISMFKRGYIKEDDLKDAVLNKVAGRVGMDGPAFDKWLQMPAVQ